MSMGVANAADRLGDVCMAKEEYAKAIDHFKRAAEICEREDDSFSILALNKKLAAAYRKQGEPEKSFELLFDMLEHYRLTKQSQRCGGGLDSYSRTVCGNRAERKSRRYL